LKAIKMDTSKNKSILKKDLPNFDMMAKIGNSGKISQEEEKRVFKEDL